MPQQAFFLSVPCSSCSPGRAPLFRDTSGAPGGTSGIFPRRDFTCSPPAKGLNAAAQREAGCGQESDVIGGAGFVVVVMFTAHDHLTCARTCQQGAIFTLQVQNNLHRTRFYCCKRECWTPIKYILSGYFLPLNPGGALLDRWMDITVCCSPFNMVKHTVPPQAKKDLKAPKITKYLHKHTEA